MKMTKQKSNYENDCICQNQGRITHRNAEEREGRDTFADNLRHADQRAPFFFAILCVMRPCQKPEYAIERYIVFVLKHH